MDCILPGSSVHGIFQARVLEWVAISFSRGSSRPRYQTQISYTSGRRFTIWATREASMLRHRCDSSDNYGGGLVDFKESLRTTLNYPDVTENFNLFSERWSIKLTFSLVLLFGESNFLNGPLEVWFMAVVLLDPGLKFVCNPKLKTTKITRWIQLGILFEICLSCPPCAGQSGSGVTADLTVCVCLGHEM